MAELIFNGPTITLSPKSFANRVRPLPIAKEPTELPGVVPSKLSICPKEKR